MHDNVDTCQTQRPQRCMNESNSPLALIARLMLSPTQLAENAIRATTDRATWIGVLFLSLDLSMPIALMLGHMAEPMPDLQVFAQNVTVGFGYAMAFLLLFLGGMAYPIVRTIENHFRENDAPANIMPFHAILLAPVVAFPCILIWCIPFAGRLIADPNFNLYGQPKPAWVAHISIAITGHPIWFGLIVAATIWITVRAVREVARRLPGDICLSCGYSLHAITSQRCPECGIAVDHQYHTTA